MKQFSSKTQQEIQKTTLDELDFFNSSLASRCSICRSHSAALRWTSVVASWWKRFGGNDWGKSLVWGVGFFFCCLPNVAANKEWGGSLRHFWQIRHESWGEKSGNAFFLVAERHSSIKTMWGKRGEAKPIFMPAKIREMNLSIPFLPRISWGFLVKSLFKRLTCISG